MKQPDILPDKYLYSQQSLAAFEKCPMKYRKRYLEGLRWDNDPGAGEPEALQRGRDFHLLARRYFLGLPDAGAEPENRDDILELWMEHLKRKFPLEPDGEYFPEYTLTLRAGILRLQATLDLVIARKDRMEIWDWKTHNPLNRSEPEQMAGKLEKSLQTKIYLYLLYEQALRKGFTAEEEIHMYYWQPEPERIIADICYDGDRHVENRRILEEKIRHIEEFDWDTFDKRLFAKQCKTCEFNWLCNSFAQS